MQPAQTSGHKADGAKQGLSGPRSSMEGPIYSFLCFLCLIQKYMCISATIVCAQEIFAKYMYCLSIN